jgi:hypothetical protein
MQALTLVFILSRLLVTTQTGFGLDIGFTDHLQIVTTNNHTTIAISTLYKLKLCLFQPAVSSPVVAW